jgi:hypothetical protein
MDCRLGSHQKAWRNEQAMGHFYEAIVEPDRRIRLKTSIHLEKGLRVVVAVPDQDVDSAPSGIALSEPTLSADWLNLEEDEAWAHLQLVM